MSEQMAVHVGGAGMLAMLVGAGTGLTGLGKASSREMDQSAHLARATAAETLLRDGPVELFGSKSEAELRAVIDEASEAAAKVGAKAGPWKAVGIAGIALFGLGTVAAIGSMPFYDESND